MLKNDQALVRAGDIGVALSLLTRIPVPGTPDYARGALAAWAYPLVGLPVAALAGGAGLLAMQAGLPSPFSALITLVFLVILTGAMHEDGLADTADGLWGGWDPEKRLAIMKDSHIGTYGVAAVFFSLAWRCAALFMLYDMGAYAAISAILVAAILSRAVMPVLMAALPAARNTGLSHRVGRVPKSTAVLAMGLAGVLAGVLIGPMAIAALVAVALTTGAVAVIAHKKIGGQTGDILGAGQQLAEIAVLTILLT